MIRTITCSCGRKVEVNCERDVSLCPSCGAIVYKRLTDYVRERMRTQLKTRRRAHETKLPR